MYFRVSAIIALLSAPLLALAQSGPNPFNIPNAGIAPQAGEPLQLNWTPTTDGTVSLILRWGPSDDLAPGVKLVSGYQNSGVYTWTPSSSLPQRSDYAIEIVSDSDPSEVNYTPPFSLDTSNSGSATSSASSSGVSSTPTSSASSVSSSALTTVKPPESTASSSSSSAGSEITESFSAAASPATHTGNIQTGASFQATSATAASSSGPATASQGSAARATAMVGMLGAVALGAFAL